MCSNRCDLPAPRERGRGTRQRALACGIALLAAVAALGADEARPPLRQVADSGLQVDTAQQQLRSLLRRARALDTNSQLRAINQFFNRQIAFASDEQAWGQADYWASPLESLNERRGDCEDYAIAKYFSLLAAGMPVSRLRFVYVRAQLDDGPTQAHMVLAYYPDAGADTLILDNLVDEVLPASQRGDLIPVYSFNSDGLWHGVGRVGAGDPALRLTRWRALLAKVRAEGLL